MTDTLSLRQLNRATLARQMLLERQASPAAAAVERLAGLQAQQARPPYVGLWTRLRDFGRDDLAELIDRRAVVKATWVRATLHLCTADDYLRLRSALQPMLTKAWSGIAKRRGTDFDLEEVLTTGRRFIDEQPRTFAEISAMLTELLPSFDVGAMRYAIRTHLPMVQVPSDNPWSYSNKPAFTLAESWLGRPMAPEDGLRELVMRYLTAFGPASVTDMQTWSGLPKLKDVFAELRPELRTYQDGRRELFDLPDRQLPGEDVPVPVRFLPEFDNLLLAHDKRQRVIADEHRSKVFLPGLRVRATFLVDGFVAGGWKIEKAGKTATLVIEPFASLARRDQIALVEEGERLVRFAEPKAKSFAVRVEEPG
ncbi:MAG: winged helix DNA-binding domain-containing protein [Thermoanaerobaculia bacterium]